MINVYEKVTERIIAELEKGLVPWNRPWSGTEDGAINYVSRKPYSFLNQLLLGDDGEYVTFKQAKACGGNVKKGATGKFVVFYTNVPYKKQKEDGTEEQGYYPCLKSYYVFNIKDCDGIEPKKVLELREHNTIEEGEAVIGGYLEREKKLKFQNDKPSNRAFYRPSTDEVVVPMLSQFGSENEYYATTFHELVHSTIPAYRCDREAENKASFFGNEDYSREELVAEMGSAMLCSFVGIEKPSTFKNSVAYIQSWLQALKNDSKMVVWAASRAEKAAKYILNIKEENKEEE
jgi:antirestriction protein ArdC